MNIGKCKLCLADEVRLLSKSHIIGKQENTRNLLNYIPTYSGNIHIQIREKDYVKEYIKTVIEKDINK